MLATIRRFQGLRRGFVAAGLLTVCSLASTARAQLPNFNPSRQYYQGTPNLGRQYFKQSGAYSPYLNLLQNSGGLTGAVPNYQSFVRPQLQQQRQNAQVNRSLQSVQGNVANLQAYQDAQQVGINGVRATGRPQAALGQFYNNRGTYFPNVR